MTWIALLAFPVACVIALFVADTRAGTTVAVLIASAGFLFGVVNGCGYKPALKHSIQEKTLTVNHKERSGGGSDGKWIVFTNHGVYSVEDSLWLWKFDASDRYNRIQVGHTYRCRMAGWRIRFSSDYQNLIGCREVSA